MGEEFVDLDRIVHEPVRLAILTALMDCRRADFVFLQSLLKLTQGNLGSHLVKLEQAGFVTITKTFRGKVPHTLVQLTKSGRRAIQTHWERLDELRKTSQRVKGRLAGTS